MEWNLVSRILVPLKYGLSAGALGPTTGIEFVEGYIIYLNLASPSTERLDLVDWSRRCFWNMRVFSFHVVAKYHKAELFWAVAVMALWAILSFCFAIDLRVVELDEEFFTVTSRL